MARKIDEIELRSEEVQEILSSVPNWMIRWGSLVLLLLVIMLLLMSYIIKYPDIVSSESLITTEIPPEKIFAKTNEKIEAILVHDNAIVKEKTPLAILKSNANYKDIFLLKSIIDTINLGNDVFHFPFDKLPILSLGDIHTDFILFENSYSKYILNKKLQPFDNEQIANKFSMIALQQRLGNTITQQRHSEKEIMLKKKEILRHQKLFDKGVISLQEFEHKKLEFLQTERNYETMNISITQIEQAISTLKKNTKGTEINKTKEEITLLQDVIHSFNQLKKSINSWELLYVLKSNIEGRVSFLNYWSTSQTVSSGDLIFSIIPSENTKLIGKLKAPSQNSGKIKNGQKVNIKLENYPHNEFGIIEGTIKKVSLLPDPEGFYLIDVSLPNKLITSYKKEIDFKQEMKGSGEIITEDLRLIERFFYQFKKLVTPDRYTYTGSEDDKEDKA
ncbi:HlyD family efflux transporter periplasmic adaptor subunit [Aquimarina macrocephali]|uniref:HlyD family efflux transporter periplasmic adaptor subunit n=1 Tax=Aquimarina macrocephali TaxID=666563 RepID=UPI003F66D2B4